jgi:hypothetical protein
VKRLGTAICIAGAAWLASVAPARATPLTVGNTPVRFALKRGFHPSSAGRTLPLVYRVTYGGCERAPPPFAGYVLVWARHRLTVTLLLRPAARPAPGIICPDVAWVAHLETRIALPHALGARALYDGATKPPRLVHASG